MNVVASPEGIIIAECRHLVCSFLQQRRLPAAVEGIGEIIIVEAIVCHHAALPVGCRQGVGLGIGVDGIALLPIPSRGLQSYRQVYVGILLQSRRIVFSVWRYDILVAACPCHLHVAGLQVHAVEVYVAHDVLLVY